MLLFLSNNETYNLSNEVLYELIWLALTPFGIEIPIFSAQSTRYLLLLISPTSNFTSHRSSSLALVALPIFLKKNSTIAATAYLRSAGKQMNTNCPTCKQTVTTTQEYILKQTRHTNTHIHTHTHRQTNAHTKYTHAHTHKHTLTLIRTHTDTHTHTRTRSKVLLLYSYDVYEKPCKGGTVYRSECSRTRVRQSFLFVP
jgi:hypothetical protein